MRQIQLVVAATVTVCTGTLSHRLAAQTGFNGVITFKSYEEGGKETSFVQTSKGHKVRVDGFGGSGGSMIIDGDTKVMMMITPEKKQYVTMTEEDMKQSAAMMAPMMEKLKGMKHETEAREKFKFSNTGKIEKVAGVPCQVWRGVYGDQEGEACLAKGVGLALAEFTFANPMMHQGQPGWDQYQQYRELVGGNKGVVKMSKIENGKTTPQLEATKIEPKIVPDDAFKPPAGYTEVKMSQMLMQAQGAMKEYQQKMKEKGQTTPQQ